MLANWLSRFSSEKAHKPQRAARPARRWLEVEALEDRTVPAAIRNLPGFGANSLPANDDGSTAAINVGFDLNFFGVVRNQVIVNNNGNVTFDTPLSQFTPTALNTDNGGVPIIAAYFGDVDTRGTGSQLVTFGTDTLCDRQVFGVNYINVGYFASNTDRLNSFQIILVDRADTGAGNFDIEFNYDQIQWETGDASGGTGGLGGDSARVGFSNGTGVAGSFFELNGSGVNGAFLDGGPNALIQQTLLSSTPGRLHFLVRNGQVVMNPQQMQGPQVNLEVTDSSRILSPFRYLAATPQTQLQRGNLTVINVAPPPAPPSGVDPTNACLDIILGPGTMMPTALAAFPGPITLVFPQLRSNVGAPPPDVQLANASGFTASGDPFITVDVGALPPLTPVLRAALQFNNPSLDAISTYFIGFPVRVFSGTFDPTLL